MPDDTRCCATCGFLHVWKYKSGSPGFIPAHRIYRETGVRSDFISQDLFCFKMVPINSEYVLPPEGGTAKATLRIGASITAVLIPEQRGSSI